MQGLTACPGSRCSVDNFSAGILAAVMAIAHCLLLAPVMLVIMGALGAGVGALINAGLLFRLGVRS